MASVIDICNLALARLGDTATVASLDPPEGSAQAEHCARFYPIARDSLLEMHSWSFATKRATLSALSQDTFNWSYGYAKPSDALRVLAVLPYLASSQEESEKFEIEVDENGAPMILTDCADATLRYTFYLTDTARFSPLFVDALSWLLASHLAGPLIKGDTGAAAAKACYNAFTGILAQAKMSDANQRKLPPEHMPGWIGARG